MIREKISFTGHYKATSMDDDCVLTFQTPLTLETGDLAQKPIKAKIIHFDCKYPKSKGVKPSYSVGFHFSKENDAIVNWVERDIIPLDNSRSWEELVEKLNGDYERVWKKILNNGLLKQVPLFPWKKRMISTLDLC